jgi:hypothetical protein
MNHNRLTLLLIALLLCAAGVWGAGTCDVTLSNMPCNVTSSLTLTAGLGEIACTENTGIGCVQIRSTGAVLDLSGNTIVATGGANNYGIYANSPNRWTIKNGNIKNAGYGIYVVGNLQNNTIQNLTIYNSTNNGIYIGNVYNTTIQNVVINKTGGSCIYVSAQATPSNQNLTLLKDSLYTDCAANGIHFNALDSTGYVTSPTVRNVTITNSNVGITLWGVQNGLMENLTITGMTDVAMSVGHDPLGETRPAINNIMQNITFANNVNGDWFFNNVSNNNTARGNLYSANPIIVRTRSPSSNFSISESTENIINLSYGSGYPFTVYANILINHASAKYINSSNGAASICSSLNCATYTPTAGQEWNVNEYDACTMPNKPVMTSQTWCKGSYYLYNVTFGANNLNLQCNGATLKGDQTPLTYGFRVFNTQNATIDGCIVTGFTRALNVFHNTIGDHTFTLKNTIVSNSSGTNIYIGGYNNTLVDNLTSFGSMTSHGLYLDSLMPSGTVNTEVKNSHFYGNEKNGIQMNSANVARMNNVRIHDNLFEYNDDNGINDLSSWNSLIYNNTFQYNNGSAVAMDFNLLSPGYLFAPLNTTYTENTFISNCLTCTSGTYEVTMSNHTHNITLRNNQYSAEVPQIRLWTADNSGRVNESKRMRVTYNNVGSVISEVYTVSNFTYNNGSINIFSSLNNATYTPTAGQTWNVAEDGVCTMPSDTVIASETDCRGTYYFTNGRTITANNLNVNCNGATLVGSFSDANGYFVTGGYTNTTISNCKIYNYTGNQIFNDKTTIQDSIISAVSNLTINNTVNIVRSNLTFLLTKNDSSGIRIGVGGGKYGNLNIQSSRLLTNSTVAGFTIYPASFTLNNMTINNTYIDGLGNPAGTTVMMSGGWTTITNNVLNNSRGFNLNGYNNNAQNYNYVLDGNTFYNTRVGFFIERTYNTMF